MKFRVDKSVLTLNIDDGSLEILTEDLSLDGQEWKIKLFKESVYSEQETGTFTFTINFRDICWDSELLASQFTDYAPKFNLWE